jgi:hypothetical protein
MTVTCPRCRRSLSTADAGGPPAFCMYCGQKLRDTPGPDPSTALFLPGASDGHDPDGPDDHAPPVGRVGGYTLLRLLGAGGMGAVYEAEAPGSGNPVAVKLLSPKLAASPVSVERFRQEGRLASQLAHPRCVFVLAADTDAGRPYIVMELMPGRTLKDLVDDRGPLPPEEAVAHTLDVIDGLAEAHRIGMIHRDVKPSNCFLTADGRVKVGDFGLSKSLAGSEDRHLTQTGTFLGTVLFAAPEQLRGDPLDYSADVYSVCATLYYLLCGQAPHHHENAAAAVARATSDPPAPLRAKRADVPPALERVVMRGLEREPDRRWPSLDDLRDALVALLPSRQTPARPRALIGAYLLDILLLSLVALIPLEVLQIVLELPHPMVLGVPLDPVGWVILLSYFGLCEGLAGATAGKALLGLRVSRVGQTGPPGVGRALLRALVFGSIWFVILAGPPMMAHALAGSGKAGEFVGNTAGLWLVPLGLAALAVQLRRSTGYRGLHDFASGCHVTRPPRSARPLRLTARFPNPLDTVFSEKEPLPAAVAGYAVRGRVWADPSGEQVWAAEDRALGRKVLLWLRPAPAAAPPEVSRPTRLRRLDSGRVVWAGTDLDWTAFAAPPGGPLLDCVRPDRPLPWADARFLIEQLVDEFRAAEADGTLPARLGLSQVWVEPNGRLKVLDFPLPVGSRAVPLEGVLPAGGAEPVRGHAPLGLVRQVASLALEGRPRVAPGQVRAPVPPHAVPLLDRLFAAGGYPTLDDLHAALAETHAHPPEVTPAIRTAQLGIQAASLAAGLALLFAVTGSLTAVLARQAELRAWQANAVLDAVREPDPADVLGSANGPAAKAVAKDRRALRRLEELRDRKHREAEDRQRALLRPQRFLYEQIPDETGDLGSKAAAELLGWATAREASAAGKSASPWGNGAEAVPAWAVLVVVPLAWVIGSAVLRGGLSMMLAGVAVVRVDGRPASRRQCALRALLVWLPVAVLLAGSVWLQTYHPGWRYAGPVLWLAAAGLLPVYVVIALRTPARPPHDRVTRTYLVPV